MKIVLPTCVSDNHLVLDKFKDGNGLIISK